MRIKNEIITIYLRNKFKSLQNITGSSHPEAFLG